MTTAIRLYRTYILSTFVPLNTIRTVSGVFLFVLFWLNLTQPNRFYRGQLGDNSPFFRLYGTTSGTTTGTTFRHLGVTISALNDQPFLRHAEGI